MPPSIEDHARACLVTDGPQRHAVPVALRYDPQQDPLAVRLVFPPDVSPDGAENEWVFTRSLLEAGMTRPAETESGDVRVWPCGRVQAVMELRSDQGMAVIQFDRAPLLRFLRRTHAAEEPVTTEAAH
ncbi:SsgA family sporulation/cell division regulator [Streptomyces chryseus]|uniref:Cell division protein n=1 Tax=Streptomyces chryseus TaxID=68186 RepID=A0ABQ3DZD9_9ACTN|nr:SsgA family sporulation/cell division regulator [Streptomyces chryseus]GGX22005.1 cell division protein [Streptomyces chryseus]GHB18281.1 cell division protein [Streptomyces chryseus]